MTIFLHIGNSMETVAENGSPRIADKVHEAPEAVRTESFFGQRTEEATSLGTSTHTTTVLSHRRPLSARQDFLADDHLFSAFPDKARSRNFSRLSFPQETASSNSTVKGVSICSHVFLADGLDSILSRDCRMLSRRGRITWATLSMSRVSGCLDPRQDQSKRSRGAR